MASSSKTTTTATTGRGISRVLDKLEKSVQDGNYYEAHQMYRTLYFRYLGQQKYNELLDMLYNGAILFLDHNQDVSGADLGILLVEVLIKSETCNYAEWSPKLCMIVRKMSTNSPERETFVTKCIKWSTQDGLFNNGHPVLHRQVAEIYWNEKNYAQARHHYLFSTDGSGCARLLVEVQMTKGFSTELDLFIAQTVLQYLCLNNAVTASQAFANYTCEHPRIKEKSPPYLLPLLNFLFFLLEAVQRGRLATFVVLCEQYKPSLTRDPSYRLYLDRIGQLFFGVAPPKKYGNNFFGNNFFSNVMDFFNRFDVDPAAGEGDEDEGGAGAT